MVYKIIKKFNKSIFVLLLMFLGLISCYDNGYEEFVPPTGNINNIQPNTLFTTTTNPDNNLAMVFRSYSTDADSYLWDFGDGNTSTEANPDYTYVKGGLYNVKLTTVSSDGLSAVDSSFVSPVFVDYSFTTVDTEVTFENLSSGAASLVWDFGDNTTIEWDNEDTEEDANFSPVHIYSTEDTYRATLYVTNYLGGVVEVTKSIEGLVLSTIPDFTFTTKGFTVEFTDASILAVSHSWDFGDGSEISTEVNPTHKYPGEGTYEVTLTTTNDAGVSKSIVKAVPIGGIEPSFKAVVQNGTADDWTKNTGDNADAWDMTPNSTIEDNSGATIDSPYRAIWYNSALDDYIDATYGSNEQPGSSSDGTYQNGEKTRSVKLSNSSRRLYQVLAVEPGVEYTFTIDTRSEAEGINTEVFILNTEITDEIGIDANKGDDSSVDAYFNITNDFNSSKGSATENTFTTTTFRFTATANIAVIYVRALNAVDSSNEVFIDNIDITTPEGGGGIEATKAAVILNGSLDEFTANKDDNNDAWEVDPPNTLKDGSDSPYLWANAGLKDLGKKAAGITTSVNSGSYALKFSDDARRAYQPFEVEVGVEYTISMFVKTETTDDFTIYMLNNEVQDESDLAGNSDKVFVVSGNDNSYQEYTFTFTPTTTTAVFYAVPFSGISGDGEVYLDDITIQTPGF